MSHLDVIPLSITKEGDKLGADFFVKACCPKHVVPQFLSDCWDLENAVGNFSLWRSSRPRSRTHARNKNVILAHFSAAVILAEGPAPLTELVNSWLRS